MPASTENLGHFFIFPTLRYESKHSNLKKKKMFYSCKIFRNPCMTIIATRLQYLQSLLHYMEKKFLVEIKSMFGKQLLSSLPIFSLDETIQQQIQEISHSQSLITTNKIVVFKVKSLCSPFALPAYRV